MTFDSLTIDLDFVRSIESDERITSLSDPGLLALKKDSAKNILKSDIEFQFNLVNEATTAKLDDLINDYTSEYQTALAYLVLYLYFKTQSESHLDYGLYKSDFYMKLYEKEKSKWFRYTESDAKVSSIINVSR